MIARLDQILAWSKQEKSRLGYFAALYRQMTIAVKRGIEDGKFQDPVRMDLLDRLFAGRYLDAFEAYRSGGTPTQAWQVAFQAAERNDLTIVQHLLLGINAHINLDLGIAAQEAAPGPQLQGLHHDFDTINAVISGLMNQVFTEIDLLSPVLAVLDKYGGRFEKRIMNISIDLARYEAWHLALSLNHRPAGDREAIIAHRDRLVVGLAHEVLDPGPLLSAALREVAARENHDVDLVIATLDNELREL